MLLPLQPRVHPPALLHTLLCVLQRHWLLCIRVLSKGRLQTIWLLRQQVWLLHNAWLGGRWLLRSENPVRNGWLLWNARLG